jgi:alkylation response protein AidB-like acyl-CoA dehydrogenase
MTIGISEEHLALHDSARRWVETHADISVARAAMEGDPAARPPFWDDLVKMGWLGLHLPEQYGGEDYGLAELAVVLEELGRVCAPGPFLPTVMASAVIDAIGTDEQKARWLPGLADGSTTGAVALGSGLQCEARDDDIEVLGELRPVLGGMGADLLVVPLPTGQGFVWGVLDASQFHMAALPGVDTTRSVAVVAIDRQHIARDQQLHGEDPSDHMRYGDRMRSLAASLIAAECVGGAAWCVDTAAEYAKVRVQFGRPIGQFQAVKHRCTDMLLRLELARAAAWDAARGGDVEQQHLAQSVAAMIAGNAFFDNAKDCIQVLGGIGYTWEHDAHIYLKRALSLHQLLDTHPSFTQRIVDLALSGTRRTFRVELPAESASYRSEVRRFLEDLRTHDKSEWNARIAESGYQVPYWPAPWGRDAGAVEQVVIDQEFTEGRVRRPHLQVGAWVLPTLIAHGNAQQRDRWIGPTMRGEIMWCQLFSEPGAGSDLASLTTRAEKADGGWSLTGQKVWTTMAHIADWGICLARTEPNAPKHNGITCFIVDMKAPGIDVRPLKELTGAEMFNEVFFDGAFVPDDCVVGEVNHGWEAGRTTLANERVSMGSGSSFGPGVESILELANRRRRYELDTELGPLLAEAHAIAVMALRTTLRALAGAKPGPEASVRKLIGVEHEQRVQEVGLALLGPDAAVDDGEAKAWIGGFLGNRALSIAGGTSDVQRNIIAERLLGLPKDP